ncbi:MAG: efflux RND transporter periplasmic adaptor subunit [Phycisphaerae bacterium]|nr:efflux RND transporter periplasmic adaptor subunit [Phycisphaerae bacterium]
MIAVLPLTWGLVWGLAGGLAWGLAGGCAKKEPSKPKPPAPAKITNAVKELELTTVTLTPEAQSRLGIETVAVEFRSMDMPRTFGGEIVPVPGESVTVSAPLSGVLLSLAGANGLMPGQGVTPGQPLHRLLLSLPQKDLLTVQQEVSAQQVELDLAQETVTRARQLLQDKVGSVRQLNEAQARLATASAALTAAQTQLKLLQNGDIDFAADGLASLNLKSPIAGVIQQVFVAPGQTVTSGQSLVSISGLNPVWVKVPVYVGELARVESDNSARVHRLSDWAGTEYQEARPVSLPVGANPETATVDLFYELDNAAQVYRIGQKVAVTLTRTARQQALVVPYASILYDMYGSAWIYIQTDPQVYRRERVQLQYVLEDQAVLSRGPGVGTKVVSAGAAELFGTEFGVGK